MTSILQAEQFDDVELTRRADDSRQSIAGGGLQDTSLASSFKDGGGGAGRCSIRLGSLLIL